MDQAEATAAAPIPLTTGQVAFFVVYVPLVVAWVWAEYLEYRKKQPKTASISRHESDLALGPVSSSEKHRDPVKHEGGATEESVSLLEKGDAKAIPGTPGTKPPPVYPSITHVYKLVALDPVFLAENRLTLRAIAEFGFLLVYFFICDRTNLVGASTKTYSRDLFLFLYLLLIIASFYTSLHKHVTPSATTGKAIQYLNRHQTEEWKGWMQVLFLMYHYYMASEIYNAIRVFIACYVWMTGFGNFSYYYIRKDFTLGRFAQMMWRLNFLVLFSCIVLDNSYMLYYICPMHTLFTLMVYVVLVIGNKYNENFYAITLKMILSLLVVIVVWEIPGVFDILWGPFTFLMGYVDPKKPDLPLLHEWHFRSGLDRYIWIVGMIMAYCHPMAERWLERLEELEPTKRITVRSIVASVAIAAGYAWYELIYRLPKVEYNKLHPYTSWIPIVVYITLRNISPTLRHWSLTLFAWLGKITLETYIAQFHIWLHTGVRNGQPFLLLTFIKDYPMLNSMLCTALYILVSWRLFELTNALKNAFVPNNNNSLLGRNMAAGVVVGIAAYAVALGIYTFPMSFLGH